MGLLARTLVLALPVIGAACYSPEVRDCTVLCASPADCAEGQICGSDNFCAAPDVSGRCAMHAGGDAGISVANDASVLDAAPLIDARPDAPTHGALTVMISGQGHVLVHGHGTCAHDSPADRCLFFVRLDMPVTVEAIAADDDWSFDEWTTSGCPGDSRTCTFQPTPASVVGAKFRKD